MVGRTAEQLGGAIAGTPAQVIDTIGLYLATAVPSNCSTCMTSTTCDSSPPRWYLRSQLVERTERRSELIGADAARSTPTCTNRRQDRSSPAPSAHAIVA